MITETACAAHVRLQGRYLEDWLGYQMQGLGRVSGAGASSPPCSFPFLSPCMRMCVYVCVCLFPLSACASLPLPRPLLSIDEIVPYHAPYMRAGVHCVTIPHP